MQWSAPSPIPAVIKSQATSSPGAGAVGGPWRARAPTRPPPVRSQPPMGAAGSAGRPHMPLIQSSRYGADSNFPFYLLGQGESESLTGPQTSCQELLIRAERHKECTRLRISRTKYGDGVRQAERGRPAAGWEAREAREARELSRIAHEVGQLSSPGLRENTERRGKPPPRFFAPLNPTLSSPHFSSNLLGPGETQRGVQAWAGFHLGSPAI